ASASRHQHSFPTRRSSDLIENNRWVLRATNSGITAAIDPYGRLVDEAPRNVRRGMEGRYAFIHATTFYSRHGDWFAYLCVIVSADRKSTRLNSSHGSISYA